MTDTLPKIRAQRWLTFYWSLLSVLTTALLLHYAAALSQEDSTTLWQWYSPYIFPTWLLMMGTLAAAETKAETGESSRALFLLCVVLIIFYGACLLHTIMASIRSEMLETGTLSNTTDTSSSKWSLIDSLKAAGGWLTGIQSVVNVALGGFFVMNSPKKDAKDDTKVPLVK